MQHTTVTRHLGEATREVKFLVPTGVADQLLEWARGHLAPDPYGTGPAADEYQTATLYCDNDSLDAYHGRGSFKRSKYRVRRYGGGSAVFLERKLRTEHRLAKRRTRVTSDDLPVLGQFALTPEAPGRWFQDRLLGRQLRPTCEVSYRRAARVGSDANGLLRLTIDRDLHAQPITAFEFTSGTGVGVMSGRTPVEMKFSVAMPAPFRELIEQHGLSPLRVSKYRMSMEALAAAGLKTLNA